MYRKCHLVCNKLFCVSYVVYLKVDDNVARRCPQKSAARQSNFFATAGLDRVINLFDASSGKTVKSLTVEFSPVAVDWNPWNDAEIAVALCDKGVDKAKSRLAFLAALLFALIYVFILK
jgi:WD40 repeat protein